MRIIKFRGKRLTDGAWIYGDFFRNRGLSFIASDGIVENPLASWRDYNVDPETVGQFIDDEATQSHIEKAAKWLTGNCKPGLLLFGTVGNGKSTLARAIGSLIGILYESAYFDQRKTVRTVSALELADIAKNEPERFNGIKKAELLAIDDVGTEPSVVKVWGNEISPFVDTIYYRYDRQLFTIMTSNLNAEDLANKYGERIADRFTEMFDRIPFINHSYRK